MRKRFVAVVAGLAVAVSGLVVSVPEAQAAGAMVSANPAMAGGSMLVKASGFGANVWVQFALSGPQSVPLVELRASGGIAQGSLPVPPMTVAGLFTLTASGPSNVGSVVSVSTTVQISSPYRLLRFDANGGSVSTSSRSALSGAALGVLPSPSRAGLCDVGSFLPV